MTLFSRKWIFLLFLVHLQQIERVKCKQEGKDNEDLDGKSYLTLGVFKEIIASPVFYEMFIPIIYNFTTPRWNKTDLTYLNWAPCVNDTYPYTSCTVTYYMNDVLKHLHIDFENLTPTEDIGNNSEYFSALQRRSNFCNKIEKHFNSPFTHHDELESYLSHLYSCSCGTDVSFLLDVNNMTETVEKYNYRVRTTFDKMGNNFYYKFYTAVKRSSNNHTNMDWTSSAVLVNSRLGLQSYFLTFYYAEQSRWSHAKMSCSSQMIPQSLVSREDFYKVLIKIGNSTFFTNNYDLSIDKDFLSRYYNLPLTDCTHTKTSFIVRILLPVVKKFHGKEIQLVELHNAPFFYKNHLCSVKLKNGNSFIFNKITGTAFHTSCRPNELCSINDYSMSDNAIDPCASAILNNSQGFQDNCDFNCVPIGKDATIQKSYIVHRIASNKYILTKTSSSTPPFKIQCQDNPSNAKEYNLNEVGAWLVTLPCDCHIVLPGQQVDLHSDLPCDEKLKLKWILPLHFIKESKYNLNVTDSDETEHFQIIHLPNQKSMSKFMSKINPMVNHPHNIKINTLLQNENHSINSLWATFTVVTLIFTTIHIYFLYEHWKNKQIFYPKNDPLYYRDADSAVAEQNL